MVNALYRVNKLFVVYLEHVELVHLLLMGDDFSLPGLEAHFLHNALFVGPGDRQAVNTGKADYTPLGLRRS